MSPTPHSSQRILDRQSMISMAVGAENGGWVLVQAQTARQLSQKIT
eukprot:COSAG01_NODE_422_length_17262_cov_42.635903_6_plen_46_part_00